jgi:lysophospholipase L1-like esterase
MPTLRATLRRLALVLGLLGAVAVGVPAMAAAPTTWRIYPLGDSITYGLFNAVDSPGGYRSPLDTMLRGDGVAHRFVGSTTANSSPSLTLHKQAHHDGHPGYRVDQDAAALDGFANPYDDTGGYWLTGISGRAPIYPDLVVIHLGTNDIGERYDPGYTYPTPTGIVDFANPRQRATFMQHLTDRLHALVDKIQQLRPNARIVLSDLIPIGTTTPDLMTGDFVPKVQGVVAAERATGKNVVFADVWGAFTSARRGHTTIRPGLLSNDTVHPTPAGYRVMARVYANAIARAI